MGVVKGRVEGNGILLSGPFTAVKALKISNIGQARKHDMTFGGGGEDYSLKWTLGALALRSTYGGNLHIVELDWDCQFMELCSGAPVRADIITSIVYYWGRG